MTQVRGVELGMAFLDGILIRAHRKGQGRLMAPRLCTNFREPRERAKGAQALSGQRVPRFAMGGDDGAVALEPAMREEALAQK